MKTSILRSAYLFAAVAAFSFTSCDKDDDKVIPDAPHNDEELITVVKLAFQDKNDAAAPVIEAIFRDSDGDGPNVPQITGATLAANRTYTLTLTLLDDHGDTTHDLTPEIADEADDHQFFFTSTPGGLISVTPTDKDSKNLPLGLKSEAVTQAAGTGTLKVILKHQPGTKNNNPQTGSTDIDIDIPVTVQ